MTFHLRSPRRYLPRPPSRSLHGLGPPTPTPSARLPDAVWRPPPGMRPRLLRQCSRSPLPSVSSAEIVSSGSVLALQSPLLRGVGGQVPTGVAGGGRGRLMGHIGRGPLSTSVVCGCLGHGGWASEGYQKDGDTWPTGGLGGATPLGSSLLPGPSSVSRWKECGPGLWRLWVSRFRSCLCLFLPRDLGWS